MEKTYKRIPFDIELAKKIQSGEIEGRIVTNSGCLVNILSFDAHQKKHILECPIVTEIQQGDLFFLDCFPFSGWHPENNESKCLFIELPEETPKHEFKTFDKVLVRDSKNWEWEPAIFSKKDGIMYVTLNEKYWNYCIPYEGNEHLVGTTNNPEYYG